MAVNKVQKSDGTVLIDLTDSTLMNASDLASGVTAYNRAGVKITGTGSGGGGGYVTQDQDGYIVLPSTGGGGGGGATQHTVYFEFSDSTNTTIPVYYDDSYIGSLITSTTPATYGQKTVSLAQLDGVTWYNPADIPIGVELIDYYEVVNGYAIVGSTGEEHVSQYSCCSDFTRIDPSMTFTYVGYQWWDMAFYDENKTYITGTIQDTYKDSAQNEYVQGTLNPSRIPPNAAYIRLSSYPHINPATPATTQIMSLIRTA